MKQIKHLVPFLFLFVWAFRTNAQITINDTITFDGIQRTFITYVPENYDGSNPVPLLLNLHGYGSNGLEQMFYGDFRSIADTAGFIIVHPDGTEDGSGITFWNAFGLPGIDDIGFLNALLDTISLAYNIDPNCIYSTGMSNGGFMSYSLGCSLSNRITAIASVTGGMYPPLQFSCSSDHPLPVMQIHGTQDGTVPYDGNFGVLPAEETVEHWVQFNNCETTATFTALPDINTNDNCTAEHYLYVNGDNGSSVEFYKIIDGDHSWPGAFININTTNMDFDASEEIWRFLHQYKLNVLSSTIEINTSSNFILYPNPTNAGTILQFENTQHREIIVTDAKGSVVLNIVTTDGTIEFRLQNPGIYSLMVLDGIKVQTQKLVQL